MSPAQEVNPSDERKIWPEQAQRHLSVEKVCKSTLSDFNQLSDPARLQPIITGLRAQLDHKIAGGF